MIATLGRLDVLQDAGKIDALIASCARLAERSAVLEARERGQTEMAETIKIDEEKVRSEARFDGSWVLQTDTRLTPTDTELTPDLVTYPDENA